MCPRALLVLILALSALPVRADDFDALRLKWFNYLSGGTNYDVADAQVQSLIRGITNAANAKWTNLNSAPGRTYLWADASSTTDSSDIPGTYNHIFDMARGYATWGGALYTNAALGADIRAALDWMYANRYNETKSEFDNWWDWEIGSPMSLNDTCVLLYDTLSSAQLANYARATSAPVHVTVAAPHTFIAAGSVWRFLDNGLNQGTDWRSNRFSDAAWRSGPGQLGLAKAMKPRSWRATGR